MKHLSHRRQLGRARRRFLAHGFTLVELLVVITIIAILVALLVVAAAGAMRRAREAQIKIEVDQIDMAFESYSQQAGGDYPPNTMTTDGVNLAIDRLVRTDFIRHFKRAFPHSAEPQQLLVALIGASQSGIGTNDPAGYLGGGMTAAEAIVFWLGGFSDDPKFPISGSGGPSYLVTDVDPIEGRNWIIPLDVARLQPRIEEGDRRGYFNDDPNVQNFGRFLTFADPRNPVQTRRINLWRYHPKNSTEPFAYFDCSRHSPSQYDVPLDGVNGGSIFAIKTRASGASGPVIKFANDRKFQILHCGIDDDWGNFTAISMAAATGPQDVLVYPDGPFTAELGDTVVNFSDRSLQNSQP